MRGLRPQVTLTIINGLITCSSHIHRFSSRNASTIISSSSSSSLRTFTSAIAVVALATKTQGFVFDSNTNLVRQKRQYTITGGCCHLWYQENDNNSNNNDCHNNMVQTNNDNKTTKKNTLRIEEENHNNEDAVLTEAVGRITLNDKNEDDVVPHQDNEIGEKKNHNNNNNINLKDDNTTSLHKNKQIQPKTTSPALEQFASWIQEGKIKNILVVVGAGISVSAGIPDFRSPGTGLYDNLQTYNLPYPEAVFDLDFYRHNPQPFVTLARELWPTGRTFLPTITHCFLTILARKKKLLRVYSQNIDGLEHFAQLPTDYLVECHGHFRTASCIRCGAEASIDATQAIILEEGRVPRCASCRKGIVKPDIVFFGEGLPDRYHSMVGPDLEKADACLVMGTSLEVAPVSLIPERLSRKSKRLLLNREVVGTFPSPPGMGRDRVELNDCDVSVRTLARLLGWLDELESLYDQVAGAGTNGDQI